MSEQMMTMALGPVPNKGRFPSEPIVRSATIEGEYRYTAERAWGAGPRILWCLLNPSVADGRRDDPTMQRMIGFSYRWGYGSLVVVNVYPIITPHPLMMRAWRAKLYAGGGRGPEADAYIDNMERVRTQIRMTEAAVAAWGNGVSAGDLDSFETEIGTDYTSAQGLSRGVLPVHKINWQCLGTTLSGAPIHPLARGRARVPDDTKLRPWRKA